MNSTFFVSKFFIILCENISIKRIVNISSNWQPLIIYNLEFARIKEYSFENTFNDYWRFLILR